MAWIVAAVQLIGYGAQDGVCKGLKKLSKEEAESGGLKLGGSKEQSASVLLLRCRSGKERTLKF